MTTLRGSINLLSGATYTDGVIMPNDSINYTGGTYKFPDFIQVEEGTIYVKGSNGQPGIAGNWYDINKIKIGSFESAGLGTDECHISPPNAAFARPNFTTADEDPFFGKIASFQSTVPSSDNGSNLISGLIMDGLAMNEGGIYYTGGIYRYTDFIAVVPGISYIKSGTQINEHCGIWYNSEKVKISEIIGDATVRLKSYTAPTNAVFVRVNFKENDTPYFGTTLKSDDINVLNIPTVITRLTSVFDTSAIVGGNITSQGDGTIVSRGVCFGLNNNPRIDGDKTSDSLEIGIIDSTIEPLIKGTKYYIAAYATNQFGTAYGATMSFTAGEELVVYMDYTKKYKLPWLKILSENINEGVQIHDKLTIPWLIDINPAVVTRSKNTFIGAMNFVIDKMLEKNANQKFCFISHYTNDTGEENNVLKPLNSAIKLLSKYWNVPYVSIIDELDASKIGRILNNDLTLNHWIKNTLVDVATDSLHPGTKMVVVDGINTWPSVTRIAELLTNKLALLRPWWSPQIKIAWYGTSIAAGWPYANESTFGDGVFMGSRYPDVIGQNLNCKVFNYAYSGSEVRNATTNEVTTDRSFLDLTQPVNYKISLMDLYGTSKEPDLVVFDFGYNDFVDDPTDFNI